MKILTLGPEGTFSHKAVLEYIQKNKLKESSTEIGFCKNISEVFDSIENYPSDSKEDCLGVVPVENMLDGSVGGSLDLLFRKKVFVIAEVVIPISHCLASSTEVNNIKNIKKVISHPKALGQCRNFINENNFETSESVSTASAMKEISDNSKEENNNPEEEKENSEEDKKIAAIGPEIAAEKYGLKILKKGVEDNKNNVTRFFVISPVNKNINESNTSNNTNKEYKTSLAIHPKKDRPGLLLDLLKSFSSRDINLTKIESRPTKDNFGEYIFYIDLEGDENDSLVEKAIEEIEQLGDVRVFGSYQKVC